MHFSVFNRLAFVVTALFSIDAHAASVLVYGPTDYQESAVAQSNGHTVTIWSSTEWSAATQSDFEAFDAIIVGDKSCSGPSSADFQTLYDTMSTWAPAITGPIVVTGTDAMCHYPNGGTGTFFNQAVDWAVGGTGTGAYISSDWGTRNFDYLSYFGSWASTTSHGDYVTIVDSTHPVISGMTESDINSWGNTYHAYLTSYPSDFDLVTTTTSGSALMIARDDQDADGDGFLIGDDCDDTDASINPGATEYCDTVDNNCDGVIDEDSAADAVTWYADTDSDGFGDAANTNVTCYIASGWLADSSDCDDSSNATYPGAPEYCDTVDTDCDGTLDEDDALDAVTWYADTDSDGFGDAANTTVTCYIASGWLADSSDCDDNASATYPGAPEYCDTVDTDCDGTLDEDDALDAATWYADTDSDGFGDSSNTNVTCYIASGWLADSSDCDDNASATYPGAPEYCDTVDTDCDGTLDEDDALDASTWYADTDSDGYGDSSVADIECYQPTGYVSDASDCDDTAALTYPGADEYCDTVDTDCDGTLDEDDALDVLTWYADNDEDSFGDMSTTDEECTQPDGFVSDSTDCDDTSGDTYPGADEYCDTVDTDCDGTLDEDDALDASTWYADTDNDGNGDAAVTDVDCYEPTGFVSDDSDCDDTDQSLNTNDFDGDLFSTCEGDCNDQDALINADVAEIWYDGVDQNCDAWSDYDQDGDGFDSANDADLDGNYGDDCDDEDFDINVDAEEMWYDGVDQNCDAWSDYDADGDGFDSESYGGDDCDDASAEVYPDAPDEPYDDIITDCNNASDYDADSDGYDSIDYGGDDCDDANSDVNVDMEEIWYDGIDQDCDGNDDDQDGDGFTVDEDCDDLDVDSWPGNGVLDAECEEIWYDTGDTGIDGDKGCEGCSGSNAPLSAAWLFGLAGLMFRRRRG